MEQRDVADWQARLESTFGPRGMGGPLWAELPAKELAYDLFVRSNLHGYLVLTNSFQTFLYDTLVACNSQYSATAATHDAPYQPTFFLECLTLFRSCRAAESLLYRGYPLDAYSLLRHMLDRTVLLGAWCQGVTNYKALNATHILGDTSSRDTDEFHDRFRKAREKEENRILGLMIGKESGFPTDTILWLRRWRSLFNLQVHGSRLAAASEFGDWIRRIEPLSIGPLPKVDSITVYSNSSPEIYWMILRILPFLQLSPGKFGDAWATRWKILNQSFDFHQAGFEALGKPMGSAVREFVERKFVLTPAHSYVEHSPDSPQLSEEGQ